MFATHYLIVMIIYYKLPTADILQHTQVFMKATSAGASRMMRTMNKDLCIDVIKLPFPQDRLFVIIGEIQTVHFFYTPCKSHLSFAFYSYNFYCTAHLYWNTAVCVVIDAIALSELFISSMLLLANDQLSSTCIHVYFILWTLLCSFMCVMVLYCLTFVYMVL